MSPGLHRYSGWPNLLAFNAVWLAAVAGASAGHGWAGPAAATLFIVIHSVCVRGATIDLKLAAVAVAMGLVLDSALAASGLARYASPGHWPAVAPLWILSMWLGFALTLRHGLGWLRGRFWVAVSFGALGGPLAYWLAATRFAAVELSGPSVYIVLALGWGFVTPLLLQCAQTFGPPVHPASAHA